MDVEGMCDSVPPEQIDRWIAYRMIQMDFRDELLETLRRGFCAVANAQGAEYETHHFDPTGKSGEQAPAEEGMTPTQVMAMHGATPSREK